MGTSKELYDLNRVYFESVYQKEPIDEKMNAGLRAYLDKKKAGKTEDKEENGNGKNGKASKGSKPDFLDLDKDGNKTEPMKSAAKSKKSVKEGSSYGITKGSGTPSGAMAAFGKAPRMQKGAMAYDGPNKAASEAKDRVMQKTKDKMKKEEYVDEKVMGADTTMRMMAAKDRAKGKDKLLSKKRGEQDAANMARKIKMSPSYAGAMGEETFQRLVDSGFFTEEEVTRILWSEFEENRQVAYEPEKHKDPDESDKPYRQRSRAARMRDPERGINSPAFKKFMADRGMSV